MRFPTVMKIVAGLIFLILLVFFVFENLDPVTIWIPMVRGRHFGLIYIILAFYLLGASNAFWMITYIGAERRKRLKLKVVPESEQSLFEDEE